MPQPTTGKATLVRSGRRSRWSPAALATAAPGPLLPWRAAGTLALLVVGAVHGFLYGPDAYRFIPTIGPLFLTTMVAAPLLGATVAVARRPVTDLLAAGFSVSVLGGYCLALLLPKGIFLFSEPYVSKAGAVAIAAEVLGALALVMAAHRSVAASGRPVPPGGSGPPEDVAAAPGSAEGQPT